MASRSRKIPGAATIRALYTVRSKPAAKPAPAFKPKNPSRSTGVKKGPAPKGGGRLY